MFFDCNWLKFSPMASFLCYNLYPKCSTRDWIKNVSINFAFDQFSALPLNLVKIILLKTQTTTDLPSLANSSLLCFCLLLFVRAVCIGMFFWHCVGMKHLGMIGRNLVISWPRYDRPRVHIFNSFYVCLVVFISS